MYKKPTGRRTFKLKSLDADMEGLAPQRVSCCRCFVVLSPYELLSCVLQAKESKAKDYEDFLDDLVEDFEVRAKINLFKDAEGLAQAAAARAERDGALVGGEDADDEAPEVRLVL